MNFESLQLAEPLLQAIRAQGYITPSPIQQQAIPLLLKGVDLLASAQTGTGKTAAFTLPILQNLMNKPRAKANQTFALILTPTRELAAQVHNNVVQYSQHTTLRSAVVFGGVNIDPQMMKLRGGVEILVATPGRLIDLYQKNAIRFDQVEILVLDEADRMLDMGFLPSIKRIVSLLPRKRQNLLFSATFSDDIRKIAKDWLTNPVEIAASPRNTTAVKVEQIIHPVDKARKVDLLSTLILQQNWQQALIFSRTKHGANKIVKLLALKNIQAAAIHGNKSQSQRTKALSDFKVGKVKILVATDIAARGIDIEQLPIVVNFDLPQVSEDYVHRIGRTGRAGCSGLAISLVCAEECKQLHEIEKMLKCHLKRLEIDDFEPKHCLPKSHNITVSEKQNTNKPKNRSYSEIRGRTDKAQRRPFIKNEKVRQE